MDYEKILNAVSSYNSILVLLLSAFLLICDLILKKRIESNITKKQEVFLKEFQKKLDVVFRDEPIRASVLSDTIKIANQKRIEIYQKLNDIIFKISGIMNNASEKEQEETRQNLWKELEEIKMEILSNSVYFGELINHLSLVQAHLFNHLRFIHSKITKSEQFDCWGNEFQNALEEMGLIERWILENMKTSCSLKQIDLSEEQIENLTKEKIKLLNQ